MTGAAYRIGERPVAEQAFYAAACDPARSVVVEACAGAGKTWMLVSRILRALLAGVEPHEVLAITFTRKAAGEMRERLDEWLLAYSVDRSTAAEREQALMQRGMTPAQAHAGAAALGALHEQLLRAGRRVEVRTFHAWFGQLLAHAPLTLLQRLGLPAAYETIEDTSVLGDELFLRLHRVVQSDPALRRDYLALVGRHRRGTVRQWLEEGWKRGPELACADAAGTAQGAVPAAAAIWPACTGLGTPAELVRRAPLADDLDALARELGAMANATPRKAAAALRQALERADATQTFLGAWDALFTAKDTPRKQLGDLPRLALVTEALERIRQMQRQQLAHEDHAAMLGLARVLLREYAELKRERALVDMADLERAAQALLGDSELAGWVQERLDQRVRQVLIDEFQDTSPLQWQALHGWLQSYAGAGGGASGQQPLAVFIVGDPKQSIYRFRGADPRIFDAARDFVLQGLEGQLLQCDHTRRNAPALVSAINAVFGEAARVDGWLPVRPHTTASSADGSLRCLPGIERPPREDAGAPPDVWRDSLTEPRSEPETRLAAAEGEQVADAVRSLIDEQGLAPGEVMVLARRRTVLGHVARALARLGVPHVLAEPLWLHRSPEALDLVALLDVLASPGHDLSLARALRSPLFGAGDDDLLWLARAARAAARPWCRALLEARDLPSAPLRRAQELLRRWLPAAAQRPPHDLLDRVLHEGDVLGRLAAAVPAARRLAACHAVHALVAAALDQDGGRFSTVYGFVRQVRAGRVRAPAAAPVQAVQLLTVHGAKGLEARAVVMADCDPAPRLPERAQVLVDWPVHEPVPRRVAFVHAAALPPSLAEAWEAHLGAQEREEINGLYVAMTRAREWLVLSRTEPHRAPRQRSWWARAQPHAGLWTPPPGAVLDRQADVLVPVAPRWRQPEPAVATAAAEDARAARLGQAVHRVLEWAAGAAPPADLEGLATAAATAFGLPGAQAGAVRKMAAAVLRSPQCAPFFGGPGLIWAGNEVPVSWGGQTLRIDRLVALARDGHTTWWVLDYKLQTHAEELERYRAQLQGYVDAVRALQPADTVRGAFISSQGTLVAL